MAGTTNANFVKQVIKLTNQERQKFGLSPLESKGRLNEAAQNHSKNMAQKDFYSHTGQDDSSCSDRIDKTGYKAETSGENIAAGQFTPKQVVEDWMDSSGHRSNILNPDYEDIGVGYYFRKNDPGYYRYHSYWTQNFAAPEDGKEWWSKYQNFEYGDEGNDKLKGIKQNDYLRGDGGNDTITGAAGDDYLRASKGRDLVKGGAGNDEILGGDGFFCGIVQTRLDDEEDANDKLYGQGGNDLIQGDGGKDYIDGGTGRDILWGGSGNDTVLGMKGNDAVSGGEGNDLLKGGKGNDVLWGDSGADTLIGVHPTTLRPGKGEQDVLTGGDDHYDWWKEQDGKDTFVLGDRRKAFYDDGKKNNAGKGDYALIRNFNTDEDIIQLHGKANDYALKNSPQGMPSGTAIFMDTAGKDELIGIVADVSDLNIKADYFNFV